MKVLHVVGGNPAGGAALGVQNLHRGLVALGVDSYVLDSTGVRSGPEPPGCAVRTKHRDYSLTLDRLLVRLRTGKVSGEFSYGLIGTALHRRVDLGHFDVVNLHWLSGFVPLASLAEIEIPTIWSLRDMWSFTGGCHMSLDCRRYEKGCGGCPQILGPGRENFTAKEIERKANSLPRGFFAAIGISRWVTEAARTSPVFRNHRVETIYNSIDTHFFSPLDRRKERQRLGIEQDDKVVLVGSQNLANPYKGIEVTLETAWALDSKGCRVVAFGRVDPHWRQRFPASTVFLGRVNYQVLRSAYTAADVFLTTSNQETFGKTVAEAMACSTPVVGSRFVGAMEPLQLAAEDLLLDSLRPSEIVDRLLNVLSLPEKRYKLLCELMRTIACDFFSLQTAASHHLSLYQEASKGNLNMDGANI